MLSEKEIKERIKCLEISMKSSEALMDNRVEVLKRCFKQNDWNSMIIYCRLLHDVLVDMKGEAVLLRMYHNILENDFV